MAKTILIKKGTVANLPNLQAGEPGWATDTSSLYVGDGVGAPVLINNPTSTFMAGVLDDADLAAALTTLGLDTSLATFALPDSTTISAFAKTLLDDTTSLAARTTLEIAATASSGYYISDYANLAAALTAISTATTTLYINANTTLTANATIPSTLSIVVTKGGSFTKASTYTLTINGPFECGPYTAFIGFAAGNVTFGSGYIGKILPQWWGAIGDGTTDCLAAINCAVSALTTGSEIFFTRGTYLVSDTVTIARSASLAGESKFYSILVAGDSFTSDKSIVSYDGTTGDRIQNIEIKNLCFLGDDDNLARALTLTWVNKSSFESLYFYNCYRGAYLDNAWGNNWKNISAYGITQETFLLHDEFSANHFDHCEARSSAGYGIKLEGGGGGVSFTACDIEGIDTETKAGIIIAPVTGTKVTGLSIIGSYFERIAGSAIEFAGVDASSVQGVSITGCYIFGGHEAHYSSEAGHATNAITMANISGFDISNNVFEDWETNAFTRDGTELNGKVWNNQGTSVTNLTNSSNAFSLSVDVQNNFAGRKVEQWAAAPNAGAHSVGDIAWHSNAASGEPLGWYCITAADPGTWKAMANLA